MKRYALLSVTDKSGIELFGKGLIERGFTLLSTGGTAQALRQSGCAVTDVSDFTGFPEMLDGRVKTLHPKIHGGILGDLRKPEHSRAMEAAGILPIEIVAVNLYAFEATVSKPHTLEEAIENIDIGGPAMVRSAAKNNANVTVVVDPADYPKVLEALDSQSIKDVRLNFAAKAFRHTAFYDATISRYLSEKVGLPGYETETFTIGLRRVQTFRYGENPHQNGALFSDPLAATYRQEGLAHAIQKWGKELSFNNIADAEAAWELVADLSPESIVIVKHGNPCGAASGRTSGESYHMARSTDPISAFGGVAAVHGKVTLETATAMTEKGNFLEIVIATEFDEDALNLFKNRAGWGQDVRLLTAELPTSHETLNIRTVRGGAIAQTSDEEPEVSDFKVVTTRIPTLEEEKAISFAWKCVKHVRSNAIVVTNENQLLGVGAGQMNRVQSVRIALEQAAPWFEKNPEKASALASEAFFPFPDSIETAAKAGIKAIIQPGGSKKDEAVIQAANAHGIAMILTGIRHFKH